MRSSIFLFVVLCILAVCVPKSPTRAEPGPNSMYRPGPCNDDPDWHTLEPHPEIEGSFIYEYYNSVHMCSGDMQFYNELSYENFTIRLTIEIGNGGKDHREKVTIYPPEGCFAYPEVLEIIDGGLESSEIFCDLLMG
jgi:hypothetical protein